MLGGREKRGGGGHAIPVDGRGAPPAASGGVESPGPDAPRLDSGAESAGRVAAWAAHVHLRGRVGGADRRGARRVGGRHRDGEGVPLVRSGTPSLRTGRVAISRGGCRRVAAAGTR